MKIQETRIKIQEASEDLQVGGILFSKYRGKLFEEDLKNFWNKMCLTLLKARVSSHSFSRNHVYILSGCKKH